MIKWREHPEMVQFMMDYIPGHEEKEIREAFNDRFGIILTEGQIGNFKNNYGVKSGTHGGCFKKGMIPQNKGKKMSPEVYEKVKRTMFRKGNIPPNHREVGTERISKDGYIEVKVAEPNKWELKHRIVWREHYGEIKDGEVIIMIDGNSLNTNIENLRKITRAELVRYNQDGLASDNVELNETALLIAKLKTAKGKKKDDISKT